MHQGIRASPGSATDLEREPKMSDAIFSQEKLPEGKNRCPRCNKVHDISSCKIAPPKKAIDPGQRALQAFMEELGSQTIHLRCPHCGTTYMLTHAPGAESTDQPADTRLADTLNAMSAAGSQSPAPQKSGCFIATAAFGDYDDPTVLALRRFRDEHLSKCSWGRAFIRLYYKMSPPMARVIAAHEWLRRACRSVLDGTVVLLRELGLDRRREQPDRETR